MASSTPGHLPPDNNPAPSYDQAASGSGSGPKAKSKVDKQPSPQQVASAVASPVKTRPPSLPGSQQPFYAPASPVPLTQTRQPLQQPSLTSLLASFAN